jgi:hypothetical protein
MAASAGRDASDLVTVHVVKAAPGAIAAKGGQQLPALKELRCAGARGALGLLRACFQRSRGRCGGARAADGARARGALTAR